MGDPFWEDFKKKMKEINEGSVARDCESCSHMIPYKREDGTWSASCEHWTCEYSPREKK